MARVLCIDCEPETVAEIKGKGHAVVSVELGYRTGKRNFPAPPHECDLIVCDLKKPACFDSTNWGPGGSNDNHRCVLVDTISNEAQLRDGHLLYKHRLIQETQLRPIIPGTFGPDDVFRAIRDAGIPFFLFLNDEWVKRAVWFPNLFNLSWRFKRTIATRVDTDKILTDRLPDLGVGLKIALPLRNSIADGPKPRFSATRISWTSFPLITNSVNDIFGQLVTLGSGSIWLLPTFEDNAVAITSIISNLGAFESTIMVNRETKVTPAVPSSVSIPAAAAAVTPRVGPDDRTVFVIHGRDERLRRGMFDFLRSLDLKPLEWTEAVKLTGKGSPYIGEILDTAFSRAQAVVVLFTPDDEARLREALCGAQEPTFETHLTPQARPNVLFEAGMAMARDPDRTILVQIGDLRPFSDIAGRHAIRMDNSTSRRQDLAVRLQSAGCIVNLSGTDWQKAGDLVPPDIQPRPSKSQASVQSLRFTGSRVLGVVQVKYGTWSVDRSNGTPAAVLEFSNEATGDANAGRIIKASLAYSDNQGERLRVAAGCWIDEQADFCQFRVEDTHSLLVAIFSGREHIALSKRRKYGDMGGEIVQVEQHLLPDFQQGFVRVRLTDADVGSLVYEGNFDLSFNPLKIGPRTIG